MDEIERRYILRVIKAVGGNKSQAATVLGFDRRTLYRKLKQFSVDVQQEGAHDAAASLVASDAFMS